MCSDLDLCVLQAWDSLWKCTFSVIWMFILGPYWATSLCARLAPDLAGIVCRGLTLLPLASLRHAVCYRSRFLVWMYNAQHVTQPATNIPPKYLPLHYWGASHQIREVYQYIIASKKSNASTNHTNGMKFNQNKFQIVYLEWKE